MSWFVFVVRLTDMFGGADRDEIVTHLRAAGVGAVSHFPAIHLHPYIAGPFGYKPGDFPAAEYISARTIALPFHGQLSDDQIDHVTTLLNQQIDQTLGARKQR